MFRLAFRVPGLFLIAVSLISIVVDAARSIAASAVTLSSFEQLWLAVEARGLAPLHTIAEGAGVPAWGPLVTQILAVPASPVLAGLGFLLLLIGDPQRKRAYA